MFKYYFLRNWFGSLGQLTWGSLPSSWAHQLGPRSRYCAGPWWSPYQQPGLSLYTLCTAGLHWPGSAGREWGRNRHHNIYTYCLVNNDLTILFHSLYGLLFVPSSQFCCRCCTRGGGELDTRWGVEQMLGLLRSSQSLSFRESSPCWVNKFMNQQIEKCWNIYVTNQDNIPLKCQPFDITINIWICFRM